MKQCYNCLKHLFWVAILLLGFSQNAQAQGLELKLQLENDGDTYGVYVRPQGFSPSDSTITGSGQVTLVAPTGFAYTSLQSVGGAWIENARVDAPTEASSRDYISFGFLQDVPQIVYSDTTETLLFTFKKVGDCPDTLYLIDNDTDPFNVLPNSAGNNPGNELSMEDIEFGGEYNYTNNYAFSAWSCEDCDGDGILNALEDTNGNGIFDPLEDISHLCDACDPYHVVSAVFGDSTSVCDGNSIDLQANMVGTWSPYELTYTDGTNDFNVTDYVSGDPITISPSTTTHYSLTNVVDSMGCVIHPDSIFGGALVTVEGPLNITSSPSNAQQCAGAGVTFNSMATNGGDGVMNFQWQVSTDNGTSWADISDGTPYSDATTNILTISDVIGLHNNQYQVKIYSIDCDTLYSSAALLEVDGPLAITASPTSVEICGEESHTFTAVAVNNGTGTILTQWELSNDNGATWSDVPNAAPYSGVTSQNLAISNTTGLNGTMYRMRVESAYCSSTYTDEALLTVEGPYTLTTDLPNDISACAGFPVFTFVNVDNPGAGPLTYQWQVSSNNGASWANLTNDPPYIGITSDTMIITDALGLGGNQYQVLISTPNCATLTSNVSTLAVDGPIDYTSQPSDFALCDEETATFTSDVVVGQGNITVTWQVSTDDGATWTNLTNVSPYSGVNGATLTVSPATSDLDGNLYRRNATSDNCVDISSDEALLTVEGGIAITTQPISVTECSGNGATFEVAVSNDGSGEVNYIWEISVDGGTNFFPLTNNGVYNGTNTNTLSISDIAGLGDAQFHVIVSTTECAMITSSNVVLTVEGPLEFDLGDHPVDASVCSGTGTTFTSTPSNLGSGTIVYQWQKSIDGGVNYIDLTAVMDGGVYSDFDTENLVISDVAGLNGILYSLQVMTGECNAINSDGALLTVEGPISIDTHPQDIATCNSESVQFTVATTNDGFVDIDFQWQASSDNSNWVNIFNNAVYNGTDTDTLSLSDPITLNGTYYRVVISTPNCSVEESNGAQLSIEGPLEITNDLEPIVTCAGSSETFSMDIAFMFAGTPNFVWEYSTNDGASWQNATGLAVASITSNATNTSLEVTDTEGLNGYLFRASVSTANCGTITSEEVLLTVEGPISIDPSAQPVDVTVCSGDPAIFDVTVTNPGAGPVLYQWQRSVNGGTTFTNLSNNATFNGTDTPILSISDVAGLYDHQFQVIVSTGQCSSEISVPATLTVEGPLEYLDHPDNVITCSGTGTNFSIQISNGGSGALGLQWQVSSDGENWTDIVNNAVYSGATTTTLILSDVTGLYDMHYRCVASTSTCIEIPSNEALLTVEGELAIDVQPVDAVECSGGGVNFTVDASNAGSGNLEYQWQISVNNGVDWTALINNSVYNGVNSSNLSVTDVAGLDDALFRCVIFTNTCPAITTNEVKLDVDGPISFDEMPADALVCSGGPATFTSVPVNNGDGTLGYQWQVSTDGINWNDLANNALYSDVNTGTLTVNDVTGLNGRLYRLQALTGTCSDFYSNPAELIVEGPLNILTQPVPVTTCVALGVTFTVEVENQGVGNIYYQWQESTNNGGTWSNLVNNDTYNGVSTDTLSLDDVASLDNFQYRVVVSSETCSELTSNEVLLGVEGPISISDHPDDITACAGTSASFSFVAENPGLGTMVYGWEYSTNGGNTWQIVPNAAPYTNVNTTTLTITDVVGLNGTRYRGTVSTGGCAELPSQYAKLTVEGPITISALADQTICSNLGGEIEAVVTNSAAGIMNYQWQVSSNSGASWTDLTDAGNYDGTSTSNLFIDTILNLNDYQYQLEVTTGTCAPFFSNAMTVTVVSDTLGFCDFDLDGLDNDTDLDDDNDSLSDSTEVYISTSDDASDYIWQFSTDTDGDGITDDEEDADEDTIDNGEETDDDGTYDGDPLDPCDPLLSAACIDIVLDINVLLQGALYESTDGLMRDDLRVEDLIPLTEPYSNMANFEHKGFGGGETIDASILDITGDDAMVDWIFVELRSAIQLDSVIATRSAILQRDGDVRDLDNVQLLTFDGIIAGEYYVSIRHRNHLGVMTNNAGLLSPTVTAFDFTDVNYSPLGSEPQKHIPEWGEMAMWAGDLNSDGKVIYQGPGNDVLSQFLKVLSASGNTNNLANYIVYGYDTQDINLDGRTIYQGPGNDRNILLFQSILDYPNNVAQNANFVIVEALP